MILQADGTVYRDPVFKQLDVLTSQACERLAEMMNKACKEHYELFQPDPVIYGPDDRMLPSTNQIKIGETLYIRRPRLGTIGGSGSK